MATLDVLRMARHARPYCLALVMLPPMLGVSSAAQDYTPTGPPPLSSQVVDAETGQPIDGAVVFAYWDRCYASFGGWAGCEFYDAEETVTGPDGRYHIRSRFTYTIPLITRVRFEGLVIFKPGYGHWQRRLSGDTEVMALPPLRTREERLDALYRLYLPLVPPEYEKRLQEAIHQERKYLGLH